MIGARARGTGTAVGTQCANSPRACAGEAAQAVGTFVAVVFVAAKAREL